MGTLRDPPPVYSSGEAPVTFKRMITKSSSNIGEILLTYGDLYNMFGGAAFTYKVIKVACWVLNTQCTANFQFKRAVYSDTEDDPDVACSDVGNGRNFPAVTFKVPPAMTKEITPNSGNATQVIFIKLGGATLVADACFQVTAMFRL